jgi:hypothetical protein
MANSTQQPSLFGRRAGSYASPEIFLWSLLALAAFSWPGCATDPYARIYLQPLAQPDQLMLQDYTQTFSRIDERGQATCVFLNEETIPSESVARHVRQTLVLRTFWQSRGRSKVNQLSGANMNLDLLWEADGQMALYRGTGFALVSEKKSSHDLKIKIRYASLQLISRTAGFSPLFQEANVTGQAATLHNPPEVDQQIEQLDKNRKTLETIGLSN